MSAALNDALRVDHRFDDAANAQMEHLVADFGRMYRERNEALREVSRAHHEALLLLAMAADCRDDDASVRMVRIGYAAEAVALLLGQPPAAAAMLRRAAPLHDIGKIGIPDEVLKKRGGYSVAERLVMNRHAAIGAGILGRSRVPLFQLAAEVARTHHERWDGGGYPAGLAGEAIPLSGRIVAVCDHFDALTMNGPEPLPDDVALQQLQAQSGKAFDPCVVDVFVTHAARLISLREHINREPPTFEQLAQPDHLGPLS